MRRLAAVATLLAVALTACTRPALTSPTLPAGEVHPVPDPQPTAEPAPPPETDAQKKYAEALALIGAGKFLEAERTLEEVVRQDAQFAEAWNDLALVRLKDFDSLFSPHPALPGRGRKEQPAIEAARRALAILHGWSFAQYNLGVALLANGEYAAAVTPLQESARQQPERPEPLAAQGLALMGEERFEEAAAACRQALAIDKAYTLAAACLDQLADGGARLPVAEAAIGSFRWDPARRNFFWVGEPANVPAREWSRTSPPWTCAFQYANGFREGFVDCYGDPWYCLWGSGTVAAGTTPAGVGVGTPLAEVTRVYGAARRSGNRLIYLAGELLLVFQLDEHDRVFWYYFGIRTPYFLIDDLIND